MREKHAHCQSCNAILSCTHSNMRHKAKYSRKVLQEQAHNYQVRVFQPLHLHLRAPSSMGASQMDALNEQLARTKLARTESDPAESTDLVLDREDLEALRIFHRSFNLPGIRLGLINPVCADDYFPSEERIGVDVEPSVDREPWGGPPSPVNLLPAQSADLLTRADMVLGADEIDEDIVDGKKAKARTQGRATTSCACLLSEGNFLRVNPWCQVGRRSLCRPTQAHGRTPGRSALVLPDHAMRNDKRGDVFAYSSLHP